MASIVSAVVTSLLEFDEIEVRREGDDIIYVFLTTGVLPSVCELKTLIWSYMAPPIKRLKIESIEEVERGRFGVKRYKVTVRGKTVGGIFSQRRFLR